MVPCYLCGTSKESKPHLYMLLITSTLLTLSVFIKIVLYRAVTITVCQLFACFFKNISSIKEDTDTHYGLSVGSIPIAIVTRCPVCYHRIPNIDYHIFKCFTIFVTPTFVGIFDDLGSIEVFDACCTHFQLAIVIDDQFKGICPGIKNFNSLFRISFISFHIPLQSHGVGGGSITYKLFPTIIGLIIRAVIHNFKWSWLIAE